ncbi:glycerophosphodiester phosphodiesterase [Acidipropionibacterium timonense]|uniref:glycerophosphodiester phosphodiesterase n=1 Tax=Acidipropionibacterium timonense TaxID=2161818 RepID=UPI0010325BF3
MVGVRADEFPYFRGGFIPLAHRGGSHLPGNEGRENTLAAFGNAVALGYDHIETDVHATRDGHLVAFHDDRLERVSDGRGLVADLTLAQIRRASVGGERVPTLDEVLDAFPEVFVNIDIKAPGAVAPLVEALARHRAWDRVCVGSFSSRRLARFRRSVGRPVATAVGPVGVGWSTLTRVGARVLAPLGAAFQIPHRARVGGRDIDLVTRPFIEAAHAAGRVVHVWTIDDPAQMHELIELGVDGIVTDRPDLLLEVMAERGMSVGG